MAEVSNMKPRCGASEPCNLQHVSAASCARFRSVNEYIEHTEMSMRMGQRAHAQHHFKLWKHITKVSAKRHKMS